MSITAQQQRSVQVTNNFELWFRYSVHKTYYEQILYA